MISASTYRSITVLSRSGLNPLTLIESLLLTSKGAEPVFVSYLKQCRPWGTPIFPCKTKYISKRHFELV